MGRKLTNEQREELILRARLERTKKNYGLLAEEYGLTPDYVKALAGGYLTPAGICSGHSDATLTGPYTAPSWQPPHKMTELTMKQLMGGRPRTVRRAFTDSEVSLSCAEPQGESIDG